jgi:hypothetical protein
MRIDLSIYLDIYIGYTSRNMYFLDSDYDFSPPLRTVVGEKDTGHAISALGNLLKNPIDRVLFYQCAWDLS